MGDPWRGRKWDQEFMNFLQKNVQLEPETGKLTFSNIYASLAINISWGGNLIPIPYSHVVWLLTHGTWPKPGNHVDHKNDNPMDNRPINLAEMTEAENQKKRRGRRVYRSYGKGKYGFGMGIDHDKRDGRFSVNRHLSRGHAVTSNSKTVRVMLGSYDNLIEAEEKVKRCIAEIEQFGLDHIPTKDPKRPKKATILLQKRRNSIRRMRNEGMTLAAISKATGFREGAIYSLVKDMDVDRRSNKKDGVKLDIEKVKTIKAEFKGGRPVRAIAREYAVSRNMIRGIINGRAWRHVE